jgi:ABC-type multidrug transport system permease subunit
MRSHPLVQLILLRFREFMREPEAIFWNFAFPLLLVAGLGVAFRDQPPEIVHVAAVTPQLVESLKVDPQLDVEQLTPEAGLQALRSARVILVVEPGADGSVVYRYDDTNPDARNARLIADRAIQKSAGRADPVASSNALVREPGSRYIDFLVPGMIGMGIMNSGMWGMVFPIVDTRRRKLLKRIVATPMPRHYYLLSYLLWRLVLLPVEVGIPLGFGMAFFGVPVRGSMFELMVWCVLGALTFSSLGLLIASRARTIEAGSGIMNIVQLPMWVVSGVFFSSDRFPAFVKPLIQALPLTALNDALRANMLRGDSMLQMKQQAAALGVCLLITFLAALKLFRWR